MKRPIRSSAVYSGGPKRSANSASVGASSISPITPRVPAMKETIAAIASARPARRHKADQRADQAADERVDQDRRLQRDREAQQQILKSLCHWLVVRGEQ